MYGVFTRGPHSQHAPPLHSQLMPAGTPGCSSNPGAQSNRQFAVENHNPDIQILMPPSCLSGSLTDTVSDSCQ